MKIRYGFVSNSSSTSFVITNKTDKNLTLRDFIVDNTILIDIWNRDYGKYSGYYTLDDLLLSADVDHIILYPGDNNINFGDHDGRFGYTPLGTAYDYVMRDGGESERWIWIFDQFNR